LRILSFVYQTSSIVCLKSEPEGLLLGPVLLQVNFVYGLRRRIVDTCELGRFGDRITFGVDKVNELASLLIGDWLVLLSHGCVDFVLE
jgi:hypothetical protein